jgi:periplasmic copper chaperone A
VRRNPPPLQATTGDRSGARRNPARPGLIVWVGFALVALLALAGLGQPPAAHAHSYKQGAIAVGHIWAPPTSEDSAAVYGALMNQGEQAERLIEASSDLADAVRFRAVENGQPNWPEVIDIAPGKVVALAPWREHLWLTGLKRPLQDGDSFEMTLAFKSAGAVTVTVLVESAAGH